MILSDRDILWGIENETITINPFDRKRLGSNSYDVTLSRNFMMYTGDVLDAKADNHAEKYVIYDDGLVLYPGHLYLMLTNEIVGSSQYVPFLDGKSSIGRLGIFIHVTAGRGDVGFMNRWTMEVAVVKPVKVYADMPIGQFIFFDTGEVIQPYDKKPNAKYNEISEWPTPSRMFMNFR